MPDFLGAAAGIVLDRALENERRRSGDECSGHRRAGEVPPSLIQRCGVNPKITARPSPGAARSTLAPKFEKRALRPSQVFDDGLRHGHEQTPAGKV
ncbi:MAG TPA: hypothetical protein VM715_00715 [Candidatus Acidoferrum sp.]|nr:hypothetical protein [Candidatus Acidoferrum sp.]